MTKPTVFKPTIEDQKRVAQTIANGLSENKGVQLSNGKVVKGKIKLSDKLIEDMPLLVKHIALDWYRDLPISKRNKLIDKYEIRNPLSNGCVLKIYQAENK